MTLRESRAEWLPALVVAVVVVGAFSSLVVPAVPGTATAITLGSGSTTYIVDDDPPVEQSEDCEADFNSIQAAVDAASAGDTVRVCGGRYNESVDVATPNLHIRATGRAVLHGHQDGKAYGYRARASEVIIRNFTIHRTSILVKDATEVRVLNNTLSHGTIAVEQTAVRTRVLNNSYPTTQEGGSRVIRVEGADTLLRGNAISGETNMCVVCIRSGATETRLVNNDITNEADDMGYGLIIEAGETVITRNTVSGGSTGIWDSGTKTEITENTVNGSGEGIEVGPASWGENHGTLVRNNTVSNTGRGIVVGGSAYNTDVRNNTITNSSNGIRLYGDDMAVLGNAVTRNEIGVTVDGDHHSDPTVRMEGNELTHNERTGLRLGINVNASNIAVHRNLFLENGEYAINNDNEYSILNATNNDWGTGLLPSSATVAYNLSDPLTDRKANGSGGNISEGAEQGVSNVHFYHPGSQEGDAESTPTATPTATSLTAGLLATPTPAATATPDGGGGGGDGNTPTGTEGGSGPDGDTPTSTAGGSGPSGASSTSTPPPTESATPPPPPPPTENATPPPPPPPPPTESATSPSTASATSPSTASATPPSTAIESPPPTTTSTEPGTATPTLPLTPPTPMPEPGFGVGAGVAGVALLFGILALKRRE